MPFKPNIVHSDESPLTAEGDIELPADLAALGEQLRDDALHLATCYPANKTRVLASASATKRRYGLAAAIAGFVSSIIAASLLAVGVFQFGIEPNNRDEGGRHLARQVDSSFVSATPAQTEVISLTELSEPELEAFFDLIESGPNTNVSVSF